MVVLDDFDFKKELNINVGKTKKKYNKVIKIKEKKKEDVVSIALRDLNTLKKEIRLEKVNGTCFIYICSKSEEEEHNAEVSIYSKGIPVGNYIINDIERNYILNIRDYAYIGSLPFIYKMNLSSNNNWEELIPFSENLIYRYLKKSQRRLIDKYKLKNENNKIFYFQTFLPLIF